MADTDNKSFTETTLNPDVTLNDIRTPAPKEEEPINKGVSLADVAPSSFNPHRSSIHTNVKLDVEGFQHEGTDPYEIRARGQSNAEKYGNSLGRIIPVMAGDVVEGAGYVGGAVVAGFAEGLAWAGGYDVSGTAIMNDNFVAAGGRDFNNYVRDTWLPVYKTQHYRDSTNVLYKVFGQGATGLSDAASFLGAAMIPGAGITKLKVGMQAVKALSKVNIKALSQVNKLTKLGKVTKAQRILNDLKVASLKVPKGTPEYAKLLKDISKQSSKLAQNSKQVGNIIDYASIHA